MILYLSFEELSALSTSAEHALAAAASAGYGIAAPPQLIDEVEHFSTLLNGDISVPSLERQIRLQHVVNHLLAGCRVRMDRVVLDQHPASEGAVSAYFAYAHVLTVSQRLEALGDEMRALVELITGNDGDSESGRRFQFPE